MSRVTLFSPGGHRFVNGPLRCCGAAAAQPGCEIEPCIPEREHVLHV